MGKVKKIIRSMRARLTTSSFGRSDDSTDSSIPSMRSRSRSTSKTQATVCSGSRTTTISNLVSEEPFCSITATLDRTLSNLFPFGDQVNMNTVPLDARVALEVNITILRFVKRLPLDELQVIGRGSTVSLFPNDNDTITSDSSLSFACRSAREVERDHAAHRHGHDGGVAHEQLNRVFPDIAEGSLVRSRALDVTSVKNSMDNSLAIHSVRRSEREYTQRKRNDANSFGRLAGPTHHDKVKHWLIHQEDLSIKAETDSSDPQYRNVDLSFRPQAHMHRTPSFTRRSFDSCDFFLESIGLLVAKDDHETIGDEDFDNLPDWSDVEDDPEYNVFFEKPEYQWSESAASSNFTAELESTTDELVRFPQHMMSDEEALPDWSDVEDEAGYNKAEKQSFTSDPSSAKGVPDLIMPAVYLPS
ncbi:unnamed protein product [Alternaria alternata]